MSGPTNNRPTAGATVVPENFRTITRSSYQPCDAVRCPGRRNRDELRLWITGASGCVPRYFVLYTARDRGSRGTGDAPRTSDGFGFGAFRCLKLPAPPRTNRLNDTDTLRPPTT